MGNSQSVGEVTPLFGLIGGVAVRHSQQVTRRLCGLLCTEPRLHTGNDLPCTAPFSWNLYPLE